MKISKWVTLIAFLAAQFSIAGTADELSGTWTLRIANLQQEVVTVANIRFTDAEGRSCLGGAWKRVVVTSTKSSDTQFFPMDEELSYLLEDGTLTIGRNEICDAYLHLDGALENGAVVGEYFQFGWGRRQLGYFTLKKARAGEGRMSVAGRAP